MRTPKAWMQWTILLAICAMSTGCSIKKLQAQRDALKSENIELRTELNATRAALEASDLERGDLLRKASELEASLASARLQAERQPALPPQTIARVQANSFAKIPGVSTSQERGRIIVRIPGDILFSPGKTSLKSSARQTLNAIAGVLNNQYRDKMIRVAGYTDTDPIRKSKWKDNLELSLQRAASVHRHLQSQGIKANRMYAAGFGQWHPNQLHSGKAQSRRVEIMVELN